MNAVELLRAFHNAMGSYSSTHEFLSPYSLFVCQVQVQQPSSPKYNGFINLIKLVGQLIALHPNYTCVFMPIV
jgi:hypothetical protein